MTVQRGEPWRTEEARYTPNLVRKWKLRSRLRDTRGGDFDEGN